MPWPMAADYSAALQNPKIAFRDRELQQCAIQRDAHNQPFGISGQFAVVYRATFSGGRSLAVRAFTSDKGKERNDRYHVISDYLHQHNHVQSLVHFRYHDKGIRSLRDGHMYPLVTMEWVSGATLYEWVRDRCGARDQRRLSRSAEQWVELIAELRDAQIAHGDLQHANIMVTEQDELKLVDYDCMCVPKLVGLANLEIGLDPYQHPERGEATKLTLDLDNFSAIFILVALRALAAAPGLWNDFVERVKYDKLLIRRQDFDRPGESDLYRALQTSPDPDVKRMAKDLFELWRVSIQDVPSLKQMLFSYDRVRSLLAQKHFDEAVDLLSRKGSTTDAPPDLQTPIRDAFERVQCRRALEPKVRAGDEAGMKQGYVPRLLDDYPAARPLVDVARHAGRVLQLLQDLQTAKQQAKFQDLVGLWDANAALLDSRTSPQVQALKRNVDEWRVKNQLCREVLGLLQQSPGDYRRLDQAWKRLGQLGGHPQADPQRPQIELAVRRGQAWEGFPRVDRTPSEQSDRELVRCWQEPLFARWPTAEAQRPALDQAKQRLQTVGQLRQRIQQQAEPTEAGERQIAQLGYAIPSGYTIDPGLRGRLDQARQRLEAFQRLQAKLDAASSEAGLVAAGAELTRLQLRPWLDRAREQRLQLAEQRVPRLNQLRQISADAPADEMDRQVLGAWDEEVLGESEEAKQWQALYETAVRRKALLDRLENAVRAGDDEAVAALAADALLEGYPLRQGLTDRVAAIRGAVEQVQRLIAALHSGDPDAFRRCFDADLVRRYAKLLALHRERLVQSVREELLPARKIGLQMFTLPRQSLTRGLRGTYQARWTWPDRRFADRCHVGVCRKLPKLGEAPKDVALPESLNPVTREQYESGGGCRVIHPKPEWHNGYVVVWALVDLGFESFTSEPLILGRLELTNPEEPPRRRRGLLG